MTFNVISLTSSVITGDGFLCEDKILENRSAPPKHDGSFEVLVVFPIFRIFFKWRSHLKISVLTDFHPK